MTNFSVILPVFNSKKHLLPCLQSVFAAISAYGKPVEVIAVDNGSTDGSWEILGDMEPMIQRYKHEGVSVASVRNQGESWSTGKYLCFLDSDCLMDVNYFAEAEKVLEQYDASGSKHVLPEGANWLEKTWYEIHARPKDGPINYINSGNFVIRRKTFERVGGFDITFRTCEDVELCQRLRKEGFTLYESHAIKAVHLGGDRDLSTFFRKNVWRGLGLKNLGKAGRMVTTMALNHAFYCAMALAVLFVHGALALRILGAVALTNFVPVGAVLYRARQSHHIYKPLQAILLYHVFLMARAMSVWETL